MKVSLVENKSDQAVTVRTAQQSELILPPGQVLKNLDVVNLDEIKSKCHVRFQLND